MELNSLLNFGDRKLVLASTSPRRADLMELVGFTFEVIASNVNEDLEEFMIPENHVLELSQKKAAKVAETVSDSVIVGADTIVVLDNKILGKPRNITHAESMLASLSGKTHTVITGFTILDSTTGYKMSEYERTHVTFRTLSAQEIARYVDMGSVLDKAGSYGIQDHGALFVTRVDGCFYNVMGFPLARFYATLRSFLPKSQPTE